MKLSIITPCYNGGRTLGDQLEGLAQQDWDEPWEVIFANNASTDDSLGIAVHFQERLSNLRIIDASAKKGQPFAMNTGAAAAKGESLAFCDADDVVGQGWVAAIGNALKRHEFVASCFDFQKLNSIPVAQTRRNRQSTGLQQPKNPPFFPHSGGCGLGIRRSLHRKIGGFDETLPFLHDTDYCWRLQMRDVKLQFVPEAVMHVRFCDTLFGIYRQACHYGEYNVLLYARYRLLGMPQVAWVKGFTGWLNLIRGIPQLRNKTGRLRWMRKFGWRVGRLRGCFKYNVLAP